MDVEAELVEVVVRVVDVVVELVGQMTVSGGYALFEHFYLEFIFNYRKCPPKKILN